MEPPDKDSDGAVPLYIYCTQYFVHELTCQSAVVAFSVVWSSYALKILESDNSPLGFSLNKYESNLVGSIPMLGSLLATLVTGYVCDSIGRKKSHILNSLLFVIAWILIVTARSTIQILIGRFLIGLSSGLSIVVVVVYVSEINHLSIRGSSTGMLALLYNIGILCSYLQGWFCSYNVICYLSVTFSTLYTLVVCCLKDTPAYLLQIGQEKEALASLKFYRGESNTTEEIIEELAYLKSQGSNGMKYRDFEKSSDEAEKEQLQNEKDVFTENENIKNENPWKLLFLVDYNRRALITIVILMVLNVSMGMIAVQAYAGVFFSKAAPTMSPHLCSVLLALVFIASSCITMVVTNMVPRRFLLITTCIIASTCLAVLGTQLRWSWGPTWMAPLAISLYCLIFQLGCINVVFVQLAECFEPQVNSTATAIVLCFMFLMNFVVLFLFVPAVDYFGIDGTFFTFAAIGVITTVVSIFFAKETRLVPLEKVQKMFAQGYLYRKCDKL